MAEELEKLSFEELLEKARKAQDAVKENKQLFKKGILADKFLALMRERDSLKKNRDKLIHEMSDFLDTKEVELEVIGPKNRACPADFRSKDHPKLPTYKFKIISRKVNMGHVYFAVYHKVAFAYKFRTTLTGRGFGGLLLKKSLFHLFENQGIKKVVGAVSTRPEETKDFIPSLFSQLRCRMKLIGFRSYEYTKSKTYYLEMREKEFKELKEKGVITDRDELRRIWEKEHHELKNIEGTDLDML